MALQLTDDLFNLLSRLADNAGMDWFYTEYRDRDTLDPDDAECLTEAFIVENFGNFSEAELRTVLDSLVTAGVSSGAADRMHVELDNYLGSPGTSPDANGNRSV